MGKFFLTIKKFLTVKKFLKDKKPVKLKLEKCYWCDMVAEWAGYNMYYMRNKKPNDIVTENEEDSCTRFACYNHKFLLELWMSRGNKRTRL